MGELNPLDVDLSYMLDVLKKIHGMKMIVFDSFQINSLLETLNSLGEMKEKKILKINNIEWHGYQNDLDKEKTKEILKKAQGIINEKFDDLEYIYLKERKYGSKLLKEKGKVWQILP